MRSKLLIGGIAVGAAFLVGTPLMAQAAGFITGADIKNSTIKSKDVKNNGLKGKDIKESSLGTVPNASNLGGMPASSFDDATVYTFTKTVASTSSDIPLPLAAGGIYDISYSAYLNGGSGPSGCYIRKFDAADNTLQYYADDESDSTTGVAFSGIDVVTGPAAGQGVELSCFSNTTWDTLSTEPIQIVVRTVNSLTNGGALTASKGTSARR